MLIEFVGGPQDGEMVSRSCRPLPYVWVDAELKFWTEPDEGRLLFRLVDVREAVAGGLVLRYMLTLNRVRCEHCGWFVPTGRRCAFCETRLPSRV